MELFFHFGPLIKKLLLITRCFTFFARSLKLILKTGNRIIQTGNGIISPTSRHLIKKVCSKDCFHFYQWVLYWFSTENGIIQAGNGIISLPFWSLIQNFLLQIFFYFLPRRLNWKLTDWLTDRPLALFPHLDLFWPIWTNLTNLDLIKSLRSLCRILLVVLFHSTWTKIRIEKYRRHNVYNKINDLTRWNV